VGIQQELFREPLPPAPCPLCGAVMDRKDPLLCPTPGCRVREGWRRAMEKMRAQKEKP
jgi:hypothetical protein